MFRGLNNFREKKKLLFTTVMMIIAILLVGLLSTIYSLALAEGLAAMGYLDLLMLFAIIASSIIVFFTSIYKVQGVLFSFKDYDLLMSLPIKNSTILASKLIGMLIINYIGIAFVLLPASVIYFIKVDNLSWVYFLILIIGSIFIPMIPLIAASIVAVLITFISTRFKYKNLTIIVLGMIFFLLIMFISFKAQHFINSFIENSSSIVEGISKVYAPAVYLKNALIEFNMIYLIKFIAVSIIPFVAFIFVFSKIFKVINGKLGESYKSANYKVGELNINSGIKALTMVELKRYFSIPIYVLNTAFGMILILVAAIASFFIGSESITMILEIPYGEEMLPISILAITIFAIGLSCTTCSSISLEGKNLWIIKSLPIEIIEIFKGKIYLNLIITIPLAVISNLLFFISLKLNINYLIFNIIISIAFAIVSAMAGLLINLYFPKLQWSNATVVVKQSASVLLSMIFTMVVMALAVSIKIFIFKNLLIFLWMILILLIILMITLWWILNSKGKERFKIL